MNNWCCYFHLNNKFHHFGKDWFHLVNIHLKHNQATLNSSLLTICFEATFFNNHTYVTELAHYTLWTHTNCISLYIKRATTAIHAYWSSFGRAFVWKFRVYWRFTWTKPCLVDTDTWYLYDYVADAYEAVFWIMNLLSLQWIPSNISEHLHPKVPFPYSTHVPPFLQYASPLGLHLSN